MRLGKHLKVGGVLNIVRHAVEINCPADSIPDNFEIDLTPFELGDSINISAVTLPEGIEMVMPGDNVQITAELIAPIAMEDGLRFAIREGGRTVGAGVVAKIFA